MSRKHQGKSTHWLFVIALILSVNFDVRLVAAEPDAVYKNVDQGSFRLLTREAGDIVIQRCEDEMPISSREECIAKAGRGLGKFPADHIPIEEFKNLLMIALKLPMGRYDAEVMNDLKLVRAGDKPQVTIVDTKTPLAELEQQRSTAELKLQNLKGTYGDPPKTPKGIEEVRKTQDQLNEINRKIESKKTEAQSVQVVQKSTTSRLNEYNAAEMRLQNRINDLVKLISDQQMPTLPVYEDWRGNDSTDFATNVLAVFFASSLADWVFVKVDDTSIASREVTQLQYAWVTGKNPSYFKEEKYCPGEHLTLTNSRGEAVPVCMRLPVETVSWNEITSIDPEAPGFLKLLSDQIHGQTHGQSQGRYVYSLPDEDLWEKAIRGGTDTDYFFGDDSDELTHFGWYYSNSVGPSGVRQPHAVATTESGANAYGIYDGHGNVWEWTSSKGAFGLARIFRGGGWHYYAVDCGSSDGGGSGPGIHCFDVGFRPVRTEKK